jgi:excisionase family DNA binding protein
MTTILDKKGAAQYLDISERTIDNLRAAGKLACSKIGRLVKFRIEDLDDFVQKQTVPVAIETKNPHA